MTDEHQGVYFDTRENKVVTSPPEQGLQIVGPDVEITPLLEREIERYRAIERGDVYEVGTVTTASMSGAPETAADVKPAKTRKA